MFVSYLIFFFSPQKYQYSPNGNSISGRFVKDLSLFPPSKRNFDPLRIVESKDFPIFAPAFPGEIGTARESAFFALFLIGESGQFAQEEVKRRGCFRCYVASNHKQHKQRSKSLIHIFLLVGVQTQPIEIRISLGGSAL